MFTKSGSGLICRKGDALGTQSVTQCSPGGYSCPAYCSCWIASQFLQQRKHFPPPLGPLLLRYLPLVIFEISPLLFESHEAPFSMWGDLGLSLYSSLHHLASLGIWSPGKCLTWNFSGALLVCPPEGFSYVMCVPLAWRRPSRSKFQG